MIVAGLLTVPATSNANSGSRAVPLTYRETPVNLKYYRRSQDVDKGVLISWLYVYVILLELKHPYFCSSIDSFIDC